MIRILHIFHNMGNGGIENFVMNYYRFINRKIIQFDFLTSVEEAGYFDEEILSLGGRLYHAYPKKKNPIKNYLSIAEIVNSQNFLIVHRHTGSAVAKMDLIASKHGGAKKLILHAHSIQAGQRWIHYLFRYFINLDTESFACSSEAGQWLFGKKKIGEVQIIKNAIDVSKYIFNREVRSKVRATNKVKDKYIIGHVGNFNEAKNHSFVIDVFYEVQKKNPKAILWLVGGGVLQKNIEEKAEQLGIKEKIVFWGVRNDVPELMQAMDVFLFPSKHEGFGMVLIEAQCTGLQCFVSEGSVPKEIDVVGSTQFLLIDLGAKIWAEKLSSVMSDEIDRTKGYKCVKDAGFDIRDAVKDLERRYLTYVRE